MLKIFARKVNRKLKEIAKKFNALYFLEDDTYKFEIDCESTQICFVMFRDNESISLDYQSTGFKWFFNLYFNLLTSNKLQAGDIIIMDEPATNLHPYGQIELRKFLKELHFLKETVFLRMTLKFQEKDSMAFRSEHLTMLMISPETLLKAISETAIFSAQLKLIAKSAKTMLKKFSDKTSAKSLLLFRL